jgi:hypothetical protein
VAYRRAGKPEEARRILNMLKDLHQAERGWVTEKMKTADDNPADSSSAPPGSALWGCTMPQPHARFE